MGVNIVMVDIVLDDVPCIGELLIERDSFRMLIGFVILTVTYVVNVGILANQRLVQIDVVDEFAVFKFLEVSNFACVANQMVDHLLEHQFEILDYKGLPDRVLVVTRSVEGEERVQHIPKTTQIVSEILALHITHTPLADASIEIALYLGRPLHIIRYVAQDYAEMVFLLQVTENGVIQDDEFFIYVDSLVLDLKIQIERFTLVDESILLDGFVPIDGGPSAIVNLADLGKQITMIGKEIHQPNGCTQKIPVLSGIIWRQVVKIVRRRSPNYSAE